MNCPCDLYKIDLCLKVIKIHNGTVYHNDKRCDIDRVRTKVEHRL